MRLCRSCGSPIKSGDKFCAKCCAKIADDVPPAPAPDAGQLQSCASCGSPIAGTEKFCGVCGAPVTPALPVPAPAEAEPFCANCGEPLDGVTKFCGSCGAAVPSAPGSRQAPPAAGPAAEQVMGVIGNAKKMKMLGASWDTYNLVITDQRMILAQMTQPMINAAIIEAQTKAKEEGRGLISQMMHQMSAMFQYSQRYFSISPDQALAENPGNRGIGNRSISSIKMKIQDAGAGGAEYNEFRMVIESTDGKYEFTIAEDDRFTTLLKDVYGEKLHMPHGYFSKAGVRIKLF